jgi:predicted secreted protein
MRRNVLTLSLLLAASPLFAQTPLAPATGTLIELSAEASRVTSNDLFRATVFAEASHANSATVARQINQQIAAALATAKDYPTVKVRTGGTQTYPMYGKLQSSLGVSQIAATPAPETAQKAEADATIAAIQAFRERAGLIAGTLGKKYKIREMNIGSNNRGPVYPMMRGKTMMAAEAAPMPIEGGESQAVVNINGKIELTD